MLPPFALFLADLNEPSLLKTAFGIAEWTNNAGSEVALTGSRLSIGLPRIVVDPATLDQQPAREAFINSLKGFPTLVVGLVPPGGRLDPSWFPVFTAAMEAGCSIASGTHDAVTNYPHLVRAAERYGVSLVDFRNDTRVFRLGTARRRTGRRLLTIGNDCACGKKYTAMKIFKRLQARGVDAHFRPTGQTGRLFIDERDKSQRWIVNDTIKADFLTGASEYLSPDAPSDHFDVIEGQAGIWHPVYGGGSVALTYGSQPDYMVMCIDPRREFHIGTSFPLADLASEIAINNAFAARTNPDTKGVVAISLNLSGYDPSFRSDALDAFREKGSKYGLYIFDPNSDAQVDILLDEVV